MSDVPTTDLVSFNEGGIVSLGTGGNPSTERLDANAALLGPVGGERTLMYVEVQELCSTDRAVQFSKIRVSRLLFKNINAELEMSRIKRWLNLRLNTKRH